MRLRLLLPWRRTDSVQSLLTGQKSALNMNAAEKHRDSFLPKIPPELRKSPRHRMEQLKELFRTRRLSEKSPPVPSQKDIALFKSSPKQFVCVELLQEGNHKAFSELISLLSSDHGRRAAVKPGSARLEAPPLEEQRDKLEAIGLHLGRAELAERTGSWTAACEQRLLLGRYFSAQRDFWLSLYFYHSCADRERGGRSKPATEARGYLSELYLQQGDLKRARQQAELFLKQAEEGGWLDSDGRPLRLWASRRLGTIYTLLGEALLADRDYDSAAALLHQGYDMAKQCEDRSMEGEVTFRLGLTSQSSGDQEAARQFFNSCIQIYSSLQDADKLVQTYKAMAKSSESEGNVDETLRLLQKSAEVCRSSKLQDKLADVCLYLGNIYYDMNQHLKACEYFLQAYKEACEAGDMALQLEAQVMVGRMCAPFSIGKHRSDMDSASTASVKRLVGWKKTRGHPDVCAD